MARKRTSENNVVASSGGGAAAAVPARRKTHRQSGAVSTPIDAPSGSADVSERVAAPSSNASQGPSREEIAAKAYSFWVERGMRGGSPEEDWLRAERELRSRTASPRT
jgi:hypothetical protein